MQILVNGTVTGLMIAALAVAFTLVYLPCRVFHLALAGIYALTPYVTMSLHQAGLPWTFAVVCALLASTLLSCSIELWNHAPLRNKRASAGAHLISSLGIYLIVTHTISILWGDQGHHLRQEIGVAFNIGSVSVARSQATEAAGCAILVVGTAILLSTTGIGLKLRALASNERQFLIEGGNVRRTRLLSFGLSGFIAAGVSLVSAYDVGFDPSVGLSVTLLAIVATVIGGRGSFVGPVFAGVILGIVRTESAWAVSAQWEDAITFVLFALSLFLLPEGLAVVTRSNRSTE